MNSSRPRVTTGWLASSASRRSQVRTKRLAAVYTWSTCRSTTLMNPTRPRGITRVTATFTHTAPTIRTPRTAPAIRTPLMLEPARSSPAPPHPGRGPRHQTRERLRRPIPGQDDQSIRSGCVAGFTALQRCLKTAMRKRSVVMAGSRGRRLTVIGGGVMGLMTAYYAAPFAEAVTVLERTRVGDPETASFCLTRSVRNDYLEPEYSRLAYESRRLWLELQALAGQPLLIDCGCLNLVKDSVTPDLASSYAVRSFAILEQLQLRREALSGA